MTTANLYLYTQIASLPEHLKAEVLNFIEFLKLKSKHSKKSRKKIKKREFGYAKNFFKISPDFDLPLDDFKEYM